MGLFGGKPKDLTSKQKMDVLHKTTEDLLTKHYYAKDLLHNTIVEAHEAVDKAHKAVEKVYVQIGKAAERKSHAETVIKEITKELGEDDKE